MSDIHSRFIVDISQVRGAFAQVRRLAQGLNGGAMAAPLKAQAGAARAANGQFVSLNKAVQQNGAALVATQGKAARLFAVLRTAGKAAVGIAAISAALFVLNKRFPIIGVKAAKAFSQIRTSGAAAGRTLASGVSRFTRYAPAAAKASLAIMGVVKAFRALRAVPKPGPVKFPTPGGGGGGRGGGFGRGLGPLAGGLAVAGGLGALGGGLVDSLRQAGEFEQLEISFEVLAGGLEPAKAALGELRTMAENTPLRFKDVAGAGKSLLAFGEGADELPGTLKKIGDISSAIGAPIGEIAEIYGKARVQGTLFAEDINQLTGRGINVISEFADILRRPKEEIKQLASEGKITFPVLERAFSNMTGKGGQFHGMMERLSKSTLGLWSTLVDRISMAREAMGKPINDALKPLLEKAVELAGGLKERAAGFGETIAVGIDYLRAAFQTLTAGDFFSIIGKGLRFAFQSAVDFLFRSFQALVASFRDAEFLRGLGEKMEEIGVKLKDTLLGAVEATLRALSEMDLVGEQFGRAADSVGYQRQIDGLNRESELRQRRKNSPEVDPLAILKENFKNAKGLFGTSNERLERELANLLAPVIEQANKNTAERKKEREEEEKKPAPARDGLIPVGGGGGAVTGAFQRAVNLVQGKTVNELVAQESKKTNDLLDAIKGSSEKTKNAAEETAKNSKKKPEVSVEVVPTFAAG